VIIGIAPAGLIVRSPRCGGGLVSVLASADAGWSVTRSPPPPLLLRPGPRPALGTSRFARHRGSSPAPPSCPSRQTSGVPPGAGPGSTSTAVPRHRPCARAATNPTTVRIRMRRFQSWLRLDPEPVQPRGLAGSLLTTGPRFPPPGPLSVGIQQQCSASMRRNVGSPDLNLGVTSGTWSSR